MLIFVNGDKLYKMSLCLFFVKQPNNLYSTYLFLTPKNSKC